MPPDFLSCTKTGKVFMIKLIASDIDGTPLPLGQRTLPAETLHLIEQLIDAGVVFSPCSGRQFASIRKLFGPLTDRCVPICDCGADSWLNGKPVHTLPMPREAVNELLHDIIAQPRCAAIASGVNGALYAFKKDWDNEEPEPSLHSPDMLPTHAPEDIPCEILRVSAFCRDGGIAMDPVFRPKWAPRGISVAVGAPAWLDFSVADKALGLSRVCEALHIPLSEVAAFGDSYNDLPMLRTAGEPWLMSIARPELQAEFAGHICTDINAQLRRYLAAAGQRT